MTTKNDLFTSKGAALILLLLLIAHVAAGTLLRSSGRELRTDPCAIFPCPEDEICIRTGTLPPADCRNPCADLACSSDKICILTGFNSPPAECICPDDFWEDESGVCVSEDTYFNEINEKTKAIGVTSDGGGDDEEYDGDICGLHGTLLTFDENGTTFCKCASGFEHLEGSISCINPEDGNACADLDCNSSNATCFAPGSTDGPRCIELDDATNHSAIEIYFKNDNDAQGANISLLYDGTIELWSSQCTGAECEIKATVNGIGLACHKMSFSIERGGGSETNDFLAPAHFDVTVNGLPVIKKGTKPTPATMIQRIPTGPYVLNCDIKQPKVAMKNLVDTDIPNNTPLNNTTETSGKESNIDIYILRTMVAVSRLVSCCSTTAPRCGRKLALAVPVRLAIV